MLLLNDHILQECSNGEYHYIAGVKNSYDLTKEKKFRLKNVKLL
jgi:hypothetical protein